MRSGLRVQPGLMTAVVADKPDETAALADRLGLAAAGRSDDDARLGDVPLLSDMRSATSCGARLWSPTPAR